MQQVCPSCGAMVRAGANFCSVCRSSLTARANLPAVLQATGSAFGDAALVASDGRRLPLTDPLTLVGRGPQSSLQLVDGSVSTRHAEIEERGGKHFVRDLGSLNHTFVNGIQIAGEAQLGPGDQIAFGLVRFTFQVGALGMPQQGGTQLVAPGQLQASLAPQMASPIAPPMQMQPPAQAGLPALRDWGNRQPALEGKVVFIDGPHKEQRGSLGTSIAAAGCLAIIATPLAFIPLLMNRDVSVYYLRLEDAHTGQQRAAKIRGEPSGMVSQGDVVALWGRVEGGSLVVRSAYNYCTDSFMRIKSGF